MSVISSAVFAVAEPLGATLSVEGGLIGPDQVARIVAGKANAQAAADYGFPRSVELRRKAEDAYRDAKAVWADRTRDVAANVQDLLRHAFGFDDIATVEAVRAGDNAFPVPLVAGGRVPIVIAPAPTADVATPIDRALHEGGEHARYRSPALLLQDCLNASDAMLWGIVSDGRRIRLMRDSVRLGRPAFLEADLSVILETDDLSSFTGLWLLMQRSRFGREGTPAECAIERWMEEASATGIAVRDKLRGGVEDALKALGAGVLADPGVREKVGRGEVAVDALFAELLRLVYRIIFLLTAEDRGLVHPPGADETAIEHYDGGYAMRRAAERARRAAWDRHADGYEAAKIVFRALGAGETRLALPALGGPFSPGRTPVLDAVRIGNAHWYAALFRIAWIADSRTGTLHRVNWRDMQTEELGSVYESLLELVPRLADGGTALAFGEGAEAKGNARKTTGSCYTPDSLVQALLDTALDPILEARRREGPAAILSLPVIDPACGSGHFLLAAARRIAEALARAQGGASFTPEMYRQALREVVARSIHGVDKNPFAVELAKVALWIETVDSGKPLGFLGANIRCGDSLFGLFDLGVLEWGIPDAAYKPLTGDDKAIAKAWGANNRDETRGQATLDFTAGGGTPLPQKVRVQTAAIHDMPEDTLEEVEAKRAAWAAYRASPERARLKCAADAYVAVFLLPRTHAPNRADPSVPTSADLAKALRGTMHGRLAGRVTDEAEHARAFHWPLEFASVMAAGGFDVVVGNPPWERVKLQEKEFFAARRPEIAEAANAAARGRLIAALASADEDSPDRLLHEAFETAKREAEAASVFARVGASARRRGGRRALPAHRPRRRQHLRAVRRTVRLAWRSIRAVGRHRADGDRDGRDDRAVLRGAGGRAAACPPRGVLEPEEAIYGRPPAAPRPRPRKAARSERGRRSPRARSACPAAPR